MYGGLIVPVVVGCAVLAHWICSGMEKWLGHSLPNGWFTCLLIVLPFFGIRLLDRLLIRMSLYFRRRDAEGNPLEPPMRHTFWFIPLPVWSYVWVVLIVGLTIWSWVSPPTEEDRRQSEELLERWRQKREASRN